MLLKQCHVQGFGKLQDFTYEFAEGLTVICAENGWGKSTLAAFLRAMFYGLPQAGSRTRLDGAERRKYKPWNGGIMGGSIVFEVNGKAYKAERTFGKKEAEDTFRLIDLSTNLTSADFSAELGKELFGLDKEAYSRSTYLPQNKISDGGMNDSIGRKLGRLAEGEEEGSNFSKAYERLDELRKKYVPDRQKDEKGYVAELTRRITDTQARLDACFRKEESARPWREKEQSAIRQRKGLETELVSCRKRLETAAAYEALAAKKQHYTELCGQEESLRVKKESMQGLFAAGVPELSELRARRQEAEEAAALTGELRSYRLDSKEQAELDALRRRFLAGVPEREVIEACICAEGERKERSRQAEQSCRQAEDTLKQAKRTRKLCMGLTLVLLLGALVFGSIGLCGKAGTKERAQSGVQETVQKEKKPSREMVLFGCCGVLLAAGLALSVVWERKRRNEKKAEAWLRTCSANAEEIRKSGIRGRELLAQYGVPEGADVTDELYRLAEEVQHYELLSCRNEKQEQCTAKREALLEGCRGVLARYQLETEDAAGNLYLLENRTRDFLRISEELAEAEKKREQFEQETPRDSFYGLTAPETGFAELQRMEQELLVRLARVTEEEKDCRSRAEEFEEEAEERPELEELYEELYGRLETKKREYFYITETMKCLKTAKEQFSSRYLRGLTNGFEKYVSLLGRQDFTKSMAGHFDGVRLDVNLNVRVAAYGEEKELGYLSTGFRDLIGLCMRFALVDALFAEEQPFLVLDDPFVNLDRDKAARAVGFLKEAAEHYQILYLVCHESRAK